METIPELRKICQGTRREADTYHGRYFARHISIYITYFCLLLGLSANTVTFISLLIGMLSVVFFSLGASSFIIWGIILLQFWYILDHVDGEIARYNKTVSLSGEYFDHINHYLIHPTIFFALGIGLYNLYKAQVYLIMGSASGLSILLIRVITNLRKLVLFSEYRSLGIATQKFPLKKSPNLLKKIFILIHGFCTYPTVMNMVTLAVMIDLFIPHKAITSILAFYSIFATLVWFSRLALFVNFRYIDAELTAVQR